ncbi:MAG: DUF3784 domain-containing protein [Lactococcus sp.]|jgi:predicted membrane protein
MVIGHNEWLALIIGVILMMTDSQLFIGKWLFLIAGYNTLSQSDREKLNGKFIGRIIGILLLLSSVIIGAMVFYPKGQTVWFVCQILLIVVTMIYLNMSKRKNK